MDTFDSHRQSFFPFGDTEVIERVRRINART